MGFLVPSSCFYNSRQPIYPPQASVSVVYCPLLFSGVYTSGELSFPFSVTRSCSFSPLIDPSSLACAFRSRVESDDAIFTILDTTSLSTLQIIRIDLKRVPVIGTSNLQISSAV